jgi:hypothetical protein
MDLSVMNDEDAWAVMGEVHKFAIKFAHQLVFKGLAAPGSGRDCDLCYSAAQRLGDRQERLAAWDQHFLQHIRRNEMPASLAFGAARRAMLTWTHHYALSDLNQVVDACWSRNRVTWLPVRTQKEALAQTEALLAGRQVPALKPKEHRVALWRAIEAYLLERLGYHKV